MTSTAKTFAGQNLRGRSFKGQDLSGADFSDTDLRGANFTGATLIGANFSKAETGVQKRWVAFQLVISFFLSELAGIFVAYTGAWVTIFFAPRYIPSSRIATGIAMIITLIIIFFAIVRQGFTVKAFGTMTWTLALVAFAYALSGSDPLVVLFAGAVVALAVVVFSVALALSEAGSFIAWLGLFLGLFQGGFVGAFAVSWSGAGSFDFALIGAGFGAVVTALLSVYTAGRALKGDPKFDELLKFIVGFASIGGTSFQGADLTKANGCN